ncbi:MAG: Vacuolar protein-sorting-associated protein 28 [Trizodia sp. TS-e1964]|nr:MAG: Vacuolar protein-sorting-associated protein 28 [Trizodia sp. TS-e1964]
MYNLRQPSYAPTPYSYTPTSTLSAKISLDEEVKLATSSTERELYDSLAEIYSVIVTLEALEKSFIKDSITESEYTETCDRLLKQYNAIISDEGVSKEFVDLGTFTLNWDIECPRASERIRVGLPTTISGSTQGNSNSQSHGQNQNNMNIHDNNNTTGTAVADATENFITFLDALKLNWLAKDSLHPLLADIIKSISKVNMGQDFEGRGKIVQWLITLNQMKATEELNEEQARELTFDIEQAYLGFKATLR